MTELVGEVVNNRLRKLMADAISMIPLADMRITDEAPDNQLARACKAISDKRTKAVIDLGHEIDDMVERQKMERGEGIYAPLLAEPLARPVEPRFIRGKAVDALMRGDIDREWLERQEALARQYRADRYIPPAGTVVHHGSASYRGPLGCTMSL